MFQHHDHCAILSPPFFFPLLFFFFYTIRVAFTKGPQPSLLVAIAFSSTILLNPNPHIDLLCTLVINYPQVETTKTSRTKAGQRHFTESHLINIFIFVRLDPRKAFIQSVQRVWVLSAHPLKPCQLYGAYCLSELLSAC